MASKVILLGQSQQKGFRNPEVQVGRKSEPPNFRPLKFVSVYIYIYRWIRGVTAVIPGLRSNASAGWTNGATPVCTLKIPSSWRGI